MRPKNGDIRLIRRFCFRKTINNIRKTGVYSFYQKFYKGYVNYEEPDWYCWYDLCWGDQPEYLL